MGRAPCCDKSKVKRGPWSPEEDATLKTYLEKHGTVTNWIALPHKAGLNRCGKSCRLRWLNYLRPDIKHGGFTEEEDNVICALYSTIGSRWSVIASQLPGRTDNDVKNYWNTKLKKKLLASGGTSNFNHNTNANNTNNTTKISSEGDKLGRFSGLISKVIEASDHSQWNSANCFIDPNLVANYGKNSTGPQVLLEQNHDHFDPINIGQFSSHQPSPDHVEFFDFGTNGNTSSSNNISSTLEVSNSSCLSRSPTLGFDNNLASWSGNINSNYNGGVNSSTGDQDHEFLMEYLGFGSSNDHVLLSGFGF